MTNENEPIDGSKQPSASSKSLLPLPDTTNPAPARICGSSPLSHTAAPEGKKKEAEKLKIPLKQTTATLSPPLGQFFINMILQIATFGAAIAFGIFAVKSINIARTANSYAAQALEEARVANQVAMLGICSQSSFVQVCACLLAYKFGCVIKPSVNIFDLFSSGE